MKLLILASFNTGVNRYLFSNRCAFRPVCLFILQFVVILLSLSPLFANSQDTLILQDEFVSINTAKFSFYHSGDEKPDLFKNSSTRWKKIKGDSYQTAIDKATTFFLAVKNNGSRDRSLKISLNNAKVGTAVLYIARKDGFDSVATNGSLIATGMRASKDRLISFPLQISSGESIDIYIRTGAERNLITVTPVLTDSSETSPYSWTDNLVVMSLVSILLMLIFGLAALYYVPVPEHWAFIAYVFFGFWYIMAASGFGSLYCWSALPWFEKNAALFFGAATMISFLEFSRKIIRAKKLYPRLNLFLVIFNIIYSAIALAAFSEQFLKIFQGAFTLISVLPYGILLVFLIIMMEISLYNIFVKRQTRFWWFAISSFCYALFSVLTILIRLAYVPENPGIVAVLVVLCVLPQMIFMLGFVINRIIGFIAHKNNEISKIRFRNQNSLSKDLQ